MHALRRFIEQQLEDNGWTPTDLSRQSGLSKQHLSKMLNDDRDRLPRMPTEETLRGLAKGLHVPLNTVVLRAAQAVGVPIDVTEVEVSSARSLTTEQLLAEVRRRIEGGAADAAPTTKAGRAGDNVTRLKPPTATHLEDLDQAAANSEGHRKPTGRQT